MAKKNTRSQDSADLQNKNAQEWFNTHWCNIKDILKDISPIVDTNILRNDPRLSDYREISLVSTYPYYVHVEIFTYLKKLSDKEHKVFLNALLYARSENELDISRFVFTACKYREQRGMNPGSVDRFDKFFCQMASDTLVYRHQGTIEGCIQFGKISNPVYKNINHDMLRALQHGPQMKHNFLICSITGNNLEQKTYYKPSTDIDVTMNCFEIHHARYYDNSSYYYDINSKCLLKKIISPSKYIHAYTYDTFSLQIWIEFLSTIIVDIGEHDTHHKIDSEGYIDYWITGYNKGKYKSIPYAWRSETNYNEVISWIVSVCSHLSSQDFPTFEEFLGMYRGACLTVPPVSLDSGFFDTSKIHPNEQTANSCNSETV